jgi:hypothetical protein
VLCDKDLHDLNGPPRLEFLRLRTSAFLGESMCRAIAGRFSRLWPGSQAEQPCARHLACRASRRGLFLLSFTDWGFHINSIFVNTRWRLVFRGISVIVRTPFR